MTAAAADGGSVVTLLRATVRGPEPVAAFTRQPEGHVAMVLLTTSPAAGSLRDGIYSRRLDRLVTLADGQLFLDTLEESLAGSTSWFMIMY